MMEHINRLFSPPPERSLAFVISASVATTIAVISISRLAFQKKQEKIYPSPRDTLLPKLTEAEISSLTYPPDVLPGGRNVESPYGTIRAYEWGPESGRKVLLVHGITTPCIALGSIAYGLVERGCRVMLIDLWGRGYSDSVADLPHDDRLYTTEILLALTSSPLSWTGGSDGGFSLIGYSLGGGIAASFASYFSAMIQSLVLFAPAGVIRPAHMSSRSRFLYSQGVVPEPLLKWLVGRRLGAGPMYKHENKAVSALPSRHAQDEKQDLGDAISAEVEPSASAASQPPLSKTRPGITVEAAVAWQLRHHGGFIHSFMSSIRFAPITNQQHLWRRLRDRRDKVLIIAGERDPIIIPRELKEDAEQLLGRERVEWRCVDGAHDFPVTEAERVVWEVAEFWGL